MPDRRASSGAVVAFRAWPLLLVVTLSQACETSVVTPVEIDQVEVVPPETTLVEGERETFSATLWERGGAELSGARATWTVDDPDVASVTSDGVVEALSAGSTRLRASVGDVSGTAALRVLLGPTLELSAHSVSFEATRGDLEPRIAEIYVDNAGAGALEGLEARAEDGGGATPSWLAAELLAPAAPTRLRLRAEPGGLETGTHEALVTVTSPQAGEPARIVVSLRVSDPDQGPACEIRSDFISGDLRIPRDTKCVISDLFVAGNLRLDAGASVVGSDIRVNGNVEAKGADQLTLTDALIFGDLRFEDGGSVSLRESHVDGKVELKSNLGSIELQDNVIDDEAKLEKNRGGPFRVVGNTIDGKLECKENDPPPTGSGNVADEKTDQCSGL